MATTKTYSMKPETVERLESYWKQTGTPMSVVINEAVKEYLDRKELGK